VKLDFGLSSNNLSAEAKRAWPFEFGLVYSVTLSKEGRLQTMLNVRNDGKESFEFQMLLHSYFAIEVSVGETFVEKLCNGIANWNCL
jgi:glucose-6-phosphate 1-epimerase